MEPLILWRVVCLISQSLDKLEDHTCLKQPENEVWTPVDISVDTPVQTTVVSQDGNLIGDQLRIKCRLLQMCSYPFNLCQFFIFFTITELAFLIESGLLCLCGRNATPQHDATTIMCRGDVELLASRNTECLLFRARLAIFDMLLVRPSQFRCNFLEVGFGLVLFSFVDDSSNTTHQNVQTQEFGL